MQCCINCVTPVQVSTGNKNTEVVGGEAARQVEFRHQREEIRGPCAHLSRVPPTSWRSSAEMRGAGKKVSVGGPKTFAPSPTAEIPKKRFVIEVFSGCARLSKDMLCVWLLAHCLWLDIEYGSACDLLQPRVLASLLKFIQNHSSEIALVWMGTPCTTWSRARKNDGGPPPLRNGSEWFWGFPNLPARDLEKISQGNALIDCSVQIAQLCSDLQIAWVLENPFTSRIWLTEPLQACLLKGASFLQTDFCAFGMPRQKSTGLIFQNFDTLRQVSKHCKTHHGRCSFPGRINISCFLAKILMVFGLPGEHSLIDTNFGGKLQTLWFPITTKKLTSCKWIGVEWHDLDLICHHNIWEKIFSMWPSLWNSNGWTSPSCRKVTLRVESGMNREASHVQSLDENE